MSDAIDDRDKVQLADAIAALRAEIEKARRASEEASLRFRIGPVQLEFELTLEKETGADAGIRFWVVSIGAKGSLASARTHRVKLTLTPEMDDGEPPYVSHKGPKID
jgi:hypothetical protein